MERDCFNCRFEHYLADEIPCIHCGIDGREYWLPKAKTNADRIRAMTDEKLCEFLSQYKFCDICEEGCSDCTYHGDCDKRLLDWLQQPAEGE